MDKTHHAGAIVVILVASQALACRAKDKALCTAAQVVQACRNGCCAGALVLGSTEQARWYGPEHDAEMPLLRLVVSPYGLRLHAPRRRAAWMGRLVGGLLECVAQERM
jgi:hypothetical protein